MGAWGAKAFENDAALDWLGALRSGGTTLDETLTFVLDAGDDYLEVDEASAALAAGELVAAAHSGRHDRLSEGARAWLVAHPDLAARVALELARRAVERVFERSEVRDLWDENGPGTEWHLDVQALIQRLAPSAKETVTKASAPPVAKKPEPKRPAPEKKPAPKKKAAKKRAGKTKKRSSAR